MGFIHDDYEEFDELSFDDVPHRRVSRKHSRRGARAAGHKQKLRPERRQWDAENWDEIDEYDDYNDVEFDAYYRSNVDH
jgi:hypothetical protein